MTATGSARQQLAACWDCPLNAGQSSGHLTHRDTRAECAAAWWRPEAPSEWLDCRMHALPAAGLPRVASCQHQPSSPQPILGYNNGLAPCDTATIQRWQPALFSFSLDSVEHKTHRPRGPPAEASNPASGAGRQAGAAVRAGCWRSSARRSKQPSMWLPLAPPTAAGRSSPWPGALLPACCRRCCSGSEQRAWRGRRPAARAATKAIARPGASCAAGRQAGRCQARAAAPALAPRPSRVGGRAPCRSFLGCAEAAPPRRPARGAQPAASRLGRPAGRRRQPGHRPTAARPP
jgi:hypothetical protein